MIRLDVGGRKFSTYRSTLTKFDGYFKNLPELKDETTTRISIDRSPKHFETVLNFMRDGDVDLPKSQKHLRQLLRETIFYGLEKLIECCKQAMARPTSEVVAVAPEEPKSPDSVVPLLPDYQVSSNELQHMVRIIGGILKELRIYNILSLPSVYTFDDYVNYCKSVISAIISTVYARISNWRDYFKTSDEAHSFIQKIIQWIYAIFAGFNRLLVPAKLSAAVYWKLALLLCVLMVFQTC